jgi:flagellar assembly protein FliH
MLCRVLPKDSQPGGTYGITPPPWLLSKSAESAPDDSRQSRSARPVSAEVNELRLRVDELTLQLDHSAKDAWEQGYRAGEAAVRRLLEGQVRETTSALAAKIVEIAALGPEILRRAEADTVRLAIEIARRVLHREVSVDPSALSALVGAALDKLRNLEIHRVRVHPDLENLLRTSLEQFGRSTAIEVLPDPTLSRGGVTFEISRGALDASVDTQLREIERGLVDQIKARA